MSLFFFSSNNGQIQAFTGNRSIIITPNFFPQELVELAKTNYGKSEELENKYLDFIRIAAQEDSIFCEEMSHFKILSQSFVAKAFFINHILLRMSYSSQTKRLEICKKSGILRRIFSYYSNWTRFFLMAYPYIECHYIKKTQQNPYDISGILPPFKEKSYTILLNKKFLQASETQLANIIDALYCGKCIKSDEKTLIYCKAITSIIHHITLKHNIINAFRVIKNHHKMIFKFISPPKATAGLTKNIQAWPLFYINPSAIIDPFCFSEDKLHAGGQEEKILDNSQWNSMLLLWHIIRFAAYYKEMLQTGEFDNETIQQLTNDQFEFIKKIINSTQYESIFYTQLNDKIFDAVKKHSNNTRQQLIDVLFSIYEDSKHTYLALLKLNPNCLCFDFSYRHI